MSMKLKNQENSLIMINLIIEQKDFQDKKVIIINLLINKIRILTIIIMLLINKLQQILIIEEGKAEIWKLIL